MDAACVKSMWKRRYLHLSSRENVRAVTVSPRPEHSPWDSHQSDDAFCPRMLLSVIHIYTKFLFRTLPS